MVYCIPSVKKVHDRELRGGGGFLFGNICKTEVISTFGENPSAEIYMKIFNLLLLEVELLLNQSKKVVVLFCFVVETEALTDWSHGVLF